MTEGEIINSKALRLDNFLEVIDVKTYIKQNRDKPQSLTKVLPKGACFDRKGSLYIPWYQNLYRKQGDKKLILYRRSDLPRRIRIGEKPNHKKEVMLTLFNTKVDWEWDDWIDGYEDKSRTFWGKVVRADLDKYYHKFKCQQQLNRVTITSKGLSNKEKKELERSLNTLQQPIPIYREFRDYLFTQVIPPPQRRRVNPPSFSNVLLLPKRLKVSGVTFNFQAYLEKEIERDMKATFRHAPLMHSYYERKTGEEGEDDTQAMTREDRINFDYVPLGEVVRAMCSIYEVNFKTSEDRYNFCNLIRKILNNSSKFIVSTQKFDLGYADINFNCVTKKLFPVWKQFASRWEPGEELQIEEDEDSLEIEYEFGYSQYRQYNYGEVIFLEGEIEGMETYHRVTIEMIQLNEEDEEEE